MQALREGRTFITNGPALDLTVGGQEPGGEVEASVGQAVPASVSWQSHYPIHRVEILYNGAVAAQKAYPEGSTGGHLEVDVHADSDGWIAARISSNARDSFSQPVFAHTSPVYVAVGREGAEKEAAARWFDGSIERSLEWVRARGRYYSDAQRQEVVDLFREGQEVYRRMLG